MGGEIAETEAFEVDAAVGGNFQHLHILEHKQTASLKGEVDETLKGEADETLDEEVDETLEGEVDETSPVFVKTLYVFPRLLGAAFSYAFFIRYCFADFFESAARTHTYSE